MGASACATGWTPLCLRPERDCLRWDWLAFASALNAAGADVAAGPPSAQARRFAAGRALARELCTQFTGAGWSEKDGVYFTGEDCAGFGDQVYLQKGGGADPMAETERVHDLVRRACAEQGELALVLRGREGASVQRAIRCTRPFEPAPSEFTIRRALPPNPPARSAP